MQAGLDGLPQSPAGIALLEVEFGQITDRIFRAGLLQRRDAVFDDGQITGRVKLLLLAATDEQHPLGQRARDLVQQQRLAAAALHIAAPEQAGEIFFAGLVHGLGLWREAAPFKDAEDETGRALFLRLAAFYIEFHSCSEIICQEMGRC